MHNAKTKHVTIQELRQRGVPITPGNKYIPKRWLPKRDIPLEEVHRRLAKIRGSLANDVAQMRDEG